MSYLIDSDIVVDALKKRPKESLLLQQLSRDGLFISIITYGEIYEGIYFGRSSKANEQGFRLFLREVEVLSLTKPIMKKFAQIRGSLRQSGNIIGDPDILIAATAIHHNLVLVTNNVRDFQRIPNLSLYTS